VNAHVGMSVGGASAHVGMMVSLVWVLKGQDLLLEGRLYPLVQWMLVLNKRKILLTCVLGNHFPPLAILTCNINDI
jgi:hypothetical protein